MSCFAELPKTNHVGVSEDTARYWRAIEQRSYYKTLRDGQELCAFPRRDLAATTAGLIIQAVGQLLRGGVPCRAYFVDAAWAPNYAKQEKADTPRTSLLAAIIDLLCDYVNDAPITDVLYRPLVDALVDIEKFTWKLDKRNKKNSCSAESNHHPLPYLPV